MSFSSHPRGHTRVLPSTRSPGGHAFGSMRWAVLLLAKTVFPSVASAAPLSTLSQHLITFAEDGPKSADDPNLYLYLGVAVFLVLLGGVFAGLTIALMGQDETYLQVIATSGDAGESKHADKVLNLLNKGKHWVLVTLLLGNVITNETLPIVLDRSLGGGWPAVLGSTVLIVIFGEIAPQSVCVRYGLSIGAFMAPFVLVLMWLLGPIAWPTAKLLDWLLGEDHGTSYKRTGLKTLVQLHKTLGTAPGERLMEDEVTIINSVLDLKEKPVGSIMTPMQDVFIMSADTVLDERMMDTILSQGYSRIPIYSPSNPRNFLGMLLVKMLITYDPEDARRVSDFSLATLPETASHTSCLDIINFFQEGKSHMVLVSDYPGQDKGALGVVTLEDVIEEVIGEEIVDESDVFVDVHKAIRRTTMAPYQRYNKRPSMDPIIINDSEREANEDEPLLSDQNGERRASQPGRPNVTRQTTFLMRRKSSNASEGARGSPAPGAVPYRTSTLEMREHLKHLGPSNLASKPRETKFKNVKIKPGVGTIPENQATTTGLNGEGQTRAGRSLSVDQQPSSRMMATRAFTMDETESSSLLRSAGRDASDGATALYAEYGSIGGNEAPKTRGASVESQSGKPMSPNQASKIAEAKAQEKLPSERDDERNRLNVPGKLVVGETGEEGDQVGSMEAPTPVRSKSGRNVRSGSITETEVHVDGMRKVVLEATSSTSDSEEDAAKMGNGEAEEGRDGSATDSTARPNKKNGKSKRKKRQK